VPVLKAWFYAGDMTGREFVYPKARATELAKRTNQPVLATQNEATTPGGLQNAVVIAIMPSGQAVDKEQVIQSRPSK